MADVTVQRSVIDGCLVLTIDGKEIRGDQQAEHLRTEFLNAVEQTGCNKVVVDFKNVDMMTTVGFRPLLSLRKKLHDHSGHLVLCNLNPLLSEVFRVTRLISTSGSSTAPFESKPDLASALEALKKP
ncbi:MAG: STAS domain-containing protein [Gemmatales bacterium]|nr:STAS domain-containing protein [Gemmatales bacterium]MDW8387267.1 STAS domain-containing protein [Gemmatales bacterium]